MTINQTIELAYPELIKMVTAITKNKVLATDLIHDSIADFKSMAVIKQKKIKKDDRIKEYIYQIAKTQYFSSSSTFHYTYRENQVLKVKEETNVEQLEIEDLDTQNTNELRLIMSAINRYCTKFEKQLIADRFIENMTYKEIGYKHSMPTYLVTEKVKSVINKIKTEIIC
jgi:RNA polymerase sigma factor (sigma-70 family)